MPITIELTMIVFMYIVPLIFEIVHFIFWRAAMRYAIHLDIKGPYKAITTLITLVFILGLLVKISIETWRALHVKTNESCGQLYLRMAMIS